MASMCRHKAGTCGRHSELALDTSFLMTQSAAKLGPFSWRNSDSGMDDHQQCQRVRCYICSVRRQVLIWLLCTTRRRRQAHLQRLQQDQGVTGSLTSSRSVKPFRNAAHRRGKMHTAAACAADTSTAGRWQRTVGPSRPEACSCSCALACMLQLALYAMSCSCRSSVQGMHPLGPLQPALGRTAGC